MGLTRTTSPPFYPQILRKTPLLEAYSTFAPLVQTLMALPYRVWRRIADWMRLKRFPVAAATGTQHRRRPTTDWMRLKRFLILGTEGGTFYTGGSLKVAAAAAVRRCLEADGPRAVRIISDVSVRGEAAPNDAALFALAMAASGGDRETRRAAGEALFKVASTGTHLLRFVSFVDGMRGWGRSLKRTVARWYTDQELGRLTCQVLREPQRYGWSHRDVLRLSHPKSPPGEGLDDLMRWITRPDTTQVHADRLPFVAAYQQLQRVGTVAGVVHLLNAHDWMSPEMVPTEHLAHEAVWEALVRELSLPALLRSLQQLPMQPESCRPVTARLTDRKALGAARLHPLALLAASNMCKGGRSPYDPRGWPAGNDEIAEALRQACMLAFDNLEPITERVYLAVEVSRAMGRRRLKRRAGYLRAREAVAIMVMDIARHAERRVILDACRNNPLARSMQRTLASRSVSGGSFGQLNEDLLGTRRWWRTRPPRGRRRPTGPAGTARTRLPCSRTWTSRWRS